jgi:hypothetical protein
LVVVAYELLVVKAKDSNEQTRPWSQALVGGRGEGISVGLEEFADQCKGLARSMRGQRGNEEDEEDEEDEEEEEEDEEDDEEEEEVEGDDTDEWYTGNVKGKGRKEPRIAIDDFESDR